MLTRDSIITLGLLCIINKLLAADKLCLCSAKYRFNCSCIHL